MIALTLLAVLTQASFRFDTNTHRVTTTSYGDMHYVMPDAGTSCTLYVKHGYHQATQTVNGASGPAYDGYTQYYTEATTHWNTVDFPSSYTVSVNIATWFWTSCSDALLVDRFELVASDGTNTWGTDNAWGWCLSKDASDADAINQHASDHYSTSSNDWNPAYAGHCYRVLKLKPNGNIDGYVNGGWENASFGRRALDSVPTTEDVQACEADEATTPSDCAALVDQILTAVINHEEEGVPAEQIHLPAASEEEQQDVASQAERRRLFDLLQRFQ